MIYLDCPHVREGEVYEHVDGKWQITYPDGRVLRGEIINEQELKRRYILLRNAIREHRMQKADDRCLDDDKKLYLALEDGIPGDFRVGDKAEMLVNCARFIERRCEGGGWPTYKQLENIVEGLLQIENNPIAVDNLINRARSFYEKDRNV